MEEGRSTSRSTRVCSDGNGILHTCDIIVLVSEYSEVVLQSLKDCILVGKAGALAQEELKRRWTMRYSASISKSWILAKDEKMASSRACLQF